MKNLPKSLQGLIESTDEEIHPGDIENIDRLHGILGRHQKLEALLSVWVSQQTQEREMRKSYARWLLIAMFVQIGLMNLLFVLIGTGCLEVEEWLAATFIGGVFAEIAGMTYIVVKHLFPQPSENVPEILEKI